jgi:multicomponent Na+:H+ antiporter subunit B
MKHNLLLRIVSAISIPFIFLFGLYVFFHGKVSPGGGFQSGAIWATGLILHSLVFGASETRRIISPKVLQFLVCVGALLYCGLGLLMVLMGGRFLEYNAMLTSVHQSQFLGVMLIEGGVHLTVFAALSLIYWRLVRE